MKVTRLRLATVLAFSFVAASASAQTGPVTENLWQLADRWLYCIAENARDCNGVIPEKYNVVTGSHKVFVEYGNVGTKFSYIAPEGFGWMNASFEVGMNFLSPQQLTDLHELKPPRPK